MDDRQCGDIHAAPEDQAAYLNAIHDQLGPRLAFWVYLPLNDIDMESYGRALGPHPFDSTKRALKLRARLDSEESCVITGTRC